MHDHIGTGAGQSFQHTKAYALCGSCHSHIVLLKTAWRHQAACHADISVRLRHGTAADQQKGFSPVIRAVLPANETDIVAGVGVPTTHKPLQKSLSRKKILAIVEFAASAETRGGNRHGKLQTGNSQAAKISQSRNTYSCVHAFDQLISHAWYELAGGEPVNVQVSRHLTCSLLLVSEQLQVQCCVIRHAGIQGQQAPRIFAEIFTDFTRLLAPCQLL